MIRIDVEEYCHSCCDFSPDVIPPTRLFSDTMAVKQTDTIVQCEHRNRCANIKRYLDRQMKGEAQG